MEEVRAQDQLEIEASNIQAAVKIFRAINNKRRLKIVRVLHKHKRMVLSSVYKETRIRATETSAHLAVLRKAGVVTRKKEWQFTYYKENSFGFTV